MNVVRAGLVVLAVIVTAGLATPALAADQDGRLAELRSAPVLPAPDGGDWVACRLDRDATGFVPTGSPCAAPCAPVTCCPQECCPRDCWDFRIALMGWLPGVNGDITLAGQEYAVDFPWTDWFDTLDSIDFVLQLGLQVRYQKWHFGLAGLRMVLGESVPIQALPKVGLAIDAELTMVVVKGTVGYELYHKSTSTQSPFPCLTVIGYAGARYYSIGVDANLAGPGGRAPTLLDETKTWVDPLVGVRGRYDLSRNWSVLLDADVGGFGVGSDFTWHVMGGVEWRPATWFGVQVGWNHLDVDYAEGSGTGLFEFDVALSGPFTNLVFTF